MVLQAEKREKEYGMTHKLKRSDDIGNLSYELVFQRYLFGRKHVFNFMNELSVQEYVILHAAVQNEKETEDGKTYLKNIAEMLEITIRQASDLVKDIKARGLVSWTHDGDGSEGTYIQTTSLGREVLSRQEKNLKEYFSNVIQKFGKENMLNLLIQMEQLDEVFQEELEAWEEKDE